MYSQNVFLNLKNKDNKKNYIKLTLFKIISLSNTM